MLYAPRPGVRTRALARTKAKEAQRFWEHRGERQAGNATEAATRMPATADARDARDRIRRTLDVARGIRRP